jgi:hypothetical protein
MSLHNLGVLLGVQGNLADARRYLVYALRIRKKVLGLDHRETASSYLHLGRVRQSQGNWVVAQRYLYRVSRLSRSSEELD